MLDLTWRQAFTQQCVKWQGSCSVAKSVVSDSATPWTAARETSLPFTVTSRFLWTRFLWLSRWTGDPPTVFGVKDEAMRY